MAKTTVPWWLAAGLAVLLFGIGILAGSANGRDYHRQLIETQNNLSAAERRIEDSQGITGSLIATAGYLGNTITEIRRAAGSVQGAVEQGAAGIDDAQRINRETGEIYKDLRDGLEGTKDSAGRIESLAIEGAGIVDRLLEGIQGAGD